MTKVVNQRYRDYEKGGEPQIASNCGLSTYHLKTSTKPNDPKSAPNFKLILQGNGLIRHVETCPDVFFFFSLQEYIQQNPLSKF
jgi:hypothetical protein